MQVDKLKIDATIIKFYDNYIVTEEIKNVKKNFEIIAVDAIKKLIKAKKL